MDMLVFSVFEGRATSWYNLIPVEEIETFVLEVVVSL